MRFVVYGGQNHFCEGKGGIEIKQRWKKRMSRKYRRKQSRAIGGMNGAYLAGVLLRHGCVF
jgi:hypothetical protein